MHHDRMKLHTMRRSGVDVWSRMFYSMPHCNWKRCQGVTKTRSEISMGLTNPRAPRSPRGNWGDRYEARRMQGDGVFDFGAPSYDPRPFYWGLDCRNHDAWASGRNYIACRKRLLTSPFLFPSIEIDGSAYLKFSISSSCLHLLRQLDHLTLSSPITMRSFCPS